MTPNANQIQETLLNFTGTLQYHLFIPANPRMVLTDGAHYLSNEAGAYWLMVFIAMAQLHPDVKPEKFQVWKMTKPTPDATTAIIVCEDGDGKKLYEQAIEYTNFPLAEIELFFIDDGTWQVILLPGEY